jgi:hypothetical protein
MRFNPIVWRNVLFLASMIRKEEARMVRTEDAQVRKLKYNDDAKEQTRTRRTGHTSSRSAIARSVGRRRRVKD